MEHDRTLETQNLGNARTVRRVLFLLRRAADDESSRELLDGMGCLIKKKKKDTLIHTEIYFQSRQSALNHNSFIGATGVLKRTSRYNIRIRADAVMRDDYVCIVQCILN